MATFTSIFIPAGGGSASTADLNGTINSGSSTSAITLSRYQLFAINATGDINIRFGNAATIPAAAATDFRIPAGEVAVYQIPAQYDSFCLFNNGSGTITYWIQPLRQML